MGLVWFGHSLGAFWSHIILATIAVSISPKPQMRHELIVRESIIDRTPSRTMKAPTSKKEKDPTPEKKGRARGSKSRASVKKGKTPAKPAKTRSSAATAPAPSKKRRRGN